MLQYIKEIYGKRLEASDGDIGHVRDVYFDDQSWKIRYVVVDTGPWLSERLILISPHAFAKRDVDEPALRVNLLKRQIEDSPSIDSHKPVSRSFEEAYHRYYAWPSYWIEAPMAAIDGYTSIMPPSEPATDGSDAKVGSDAHLQSAKEIGGYRIQEADGSIGHLTGFVIDEGPWSIRDLVVETGHWYAGKEILIPAGNVARIECAESKIFLNVPRSEVQRAAEERRAKAGGDFQTADNVLG